MKNESNHYIIFNGSNLDFKLHRCNKWFEPLGYLKMLLVRTANGMDSIKKTWVCLHIAG